MNDKKYIYNGRKPLRYHLGFNKGDVCVIVDQCAGTLDMVRIQGGSNLLQTIFAVDLAHSFDGAPIDNDEVDKW